MSHKEEQERQALAEDAAEDLELNDEEAEEVTGGAVPIPASWDAKGNLKQA